MSIYVYIYIYIYLSIASLLIAILITTILFFFFFLSTSIFSKRKNFPFNFFLDHHANASRAIISPAQTTESSDIYPLFIGFLSLLLLLFFLLPFFPSSCPLFMNIPATITKRPLSFAGEYSDVVASLERQPNARPRLETLLPSVANVKRDSVTRATRLFRVERLMRGERRGWRETCRVEFLFVRVNFYSHEQKVAFVWMDSKYGNVFVG